MSKQHTTGPWVAIKLDESSWVVGTLAPKVRKVVAYIYGNRGKIKGGADAHLIAAAPDMLAALKDMLPEANGSDHHLRPSFERCEAARAAIAKATGE